MNRTISEIKVGESQIRYRTRIEDDDSPANTPEARVRQHDFLKQLVNQWVLLSCGMQMFQTLKMYHDGERWICEAEALVDKESHVA